MVWQGVGEPLLCFRYEMMKLFIVGLFLFALTWVIQTS